MQHQPILKSLALSETKILYYGVHQRPYGKFLLISTDKMIVGLYWLKDPELSTLNKIKLMFPSIQLKRHQSLTKRLILSAEQDHPLLAVSGTDFQKTVWQALMAIPKGSSKTYQNIANTIKRPTAVRAVANAIGKNPICYFIPCHRVIRTDGGLGGYSGVGGLAKKKALLQAEGVFTVKK